MSYQGGKVKLGSKIHHVISLIENFFEDDKLEYFEPFVGFCGVMRHFAKEKDRTCFGCDLNTDIVLMWQKLQKGWNPPINCNKDEYLKLKKSKTHSAKRGFLGVACSYGGIFFVGYRSNQRLGSRNRKSVNLTRDSILKTADDVKNVKFFESKSYDKFKPKNQLIYADPPYAENKYTQSEFFKFDSDHFWDVMRKWSKNNIVVISERNAPPDFKKIWSTELGVNHNSKQSKHNECLYMHDILYQELDSKIKKELKNI